MRIKGLPTAKINALIDNHTKKQFTKQYLESFEFERLRIEKLIDEGYRVVRGPDALVNDALRQLSYRYDQDASKEQTSVEGTAVQDNQVLSRVPSQKLSTLIRRKNKELKRKIKEQEQMQERLARSERDELDLDDAALEQTLKSGGNQSQRTILGKQNVSTMMLSGNTSMGVAGTRKKAPWMVTSQIVQPETLNGTTRVITRKLNQVVKNPPSMASMGNSNYKVAHMASRPFRRRNKPARSSTITNGLNQTVSANDRRTVDTKTNTITIQNFNPISAHSGQKSPVSSGTVEPHSVDASPPEQGGVTDAMTFNTKEFAEAEKAEQLTEGAHE